jgi:hypothetical protein
VKKDCHYLPAEKEENVCSALPVAEETGIVK